MIPNEKIRVFISSACGDEPEKRKYNLVRAGLKALIDATQMATAYTFESAGASTVSALQHYRSYLEDCDVCIFLIDNKDGVTNGVQEEIDIVNKHGILAFYYFCDEFSKEKTPLQKSLLGQNYPKCKTINSFEEFIERGAQDLIDDIVFLYKQFCKNKIGWREELEQEIGGSLYADFLTRSESIAGKSVTTAIDCSKNYFSKLILEQPTEIVNSNRIDQLCAAFLPVLFEGHKLNGQQLVKLKNGLKEYQSEDHHSVTRKRLDAFEAHFSGDQETCLVELDEALKLAKKKSLPSWIINDILVDLRNQAIIFAESQNRYLIDNKYQDELNESDSMLHYPLIDRFSSMYYKELTKEHFSYKTQSPYAVTLGHPLQVFVDSLAGSFVLAMFNGSLTHMYLIYNKIMYLTFYLSQRYSNWNIKKLLLKTAIINGRSKDVDGIIECFSDTLGKMDANDACEIYNFTDNIPVAHQRAKAKLEAFRVIGYFLDDEQFRLARDEIAELMDAWLDGDNDSAPISLGHSIFPALRGTYYRHEPEQIIDFLCKCLELGKRRFFREVFGLIANYVSLKELSDEKAQKLLALMIEQISDEKDAVDLKGLESAVIALRMQDKEVTEDLDAAVAKHMPEFYEDVYKLETTEDENSDMPGFIRKYVEEIRKANETQGQGGRYSGFAYSSHTVIQRIIQTSEAKFEQALIDSVFEVAADTLFREKQTVDAKMDAISLLIVLIKTFPKILSRHDEIVTKILANKEAIETGKRNILTNFTEANLRFSALLLYHALGDDTNIQLMGALSEIGNDTLAQITAAQALLPFIEAESDALDPRLEFIILQNSIAWCNSSSLRVRREAVNILFSLLRNPENKSPVCNQLIRLMDVDHANIKNLILRNAYRLEEVDKPIYEYIIQKASLDTNYVVRKAVENMRLDKNQSAL